MTGDKAHIHVANEFAKQMRDHFDYQYDKLTEMERMTLHQVSKGDSAVSNLKSLQTLDGYGFIEQSNGEYKVLGQALDEYLFTHHIKQ